MDDLFRISSLSGLAKDIQLALAPVFLLSAIGSVLNTLAGRLARVVDRARWLEQNFVAADDPERPRQISELRLLRRRMRIVNRAIFLCTASAVTLCTVVAAMFIARLAGFGFARTLSIAFAGSLLLLIAGLLFFLWEIRMAGAANEMGIDFIDT